MLDCNCCLLCSTLGARPLRVLVVGRTASGPSVTHRQGLTYTMPDPSTAGPLATARQSSDGRTGRHSAGRRRLMQSVGHTAPGLLGRLPGTPRPWPLQGGKARRAWGRGLPPPPPPPLLAGRAEAAAGCDAERHRRAAAPHPHPQLGAPPPSTTHVLAIGTVVWLGCPRLVGWRGAPCWLAGRATAAGRRRTRAVPPAGQAPSVPASTA